MKRNSSPEQLQSLLLKFFNSFPDSTSRRRAVINIVWQQIVGPIIGPHTHVDRWDSQNRLHIILSENTWITPLNSSKTFILDKFNAAVKDYLGDTFHVTDFVVILNEKTVSENGKKIQERNRSRDAVLEETAMQIPDEKLRESFLKAYRNYPLASDDNGSDAEN